MRQALASAATLTVLCAVLGSATVQAKEIWKYDDGPDDLGSLAGSKMHPQYAHPGFVNGEAFGVLFRPKKEQYPVEIVSVELVMAAASSAPDPTKKTLNAVIEFWNDTSDASAPTSTKPVWSVNTADFFNPTTGKPGTPIQGNTVMIYEFTSTKPGDKPPLIKEGNIRVVVRITSNATDLSSYWGKTDCLKTSIGGIDVGCGCQELAALTDTATTPKTQLMHIVWPLGTCSGSKQWRFVEDINNGLIQMKGDFRLRLGVKGTGGGGTTDAGSTGGDAGTTDSGASDTGVADTGVTDTGPADTGPAPVLKPIVDVVTPSKVSGDKPTEIEIIGEHFQTGAVVKVGAAKTSVTAVKPNKIVATVLPGISAGTYPLIVENPDGQVGFKDNAITVEAAPVEVDAGVDSGPVTGPGELTIDMVDPKCVDSARDTAITIFGTGFAEGITLQAGGKELLAVQVKSASKITALVPKGLPAGEHSLIAAIGTKQTALANAIQVDCGAGSGDSGCTAAPAPGAPLSGLGGLLLLLVGALLLRRRAA